MENPTLEILLFDLVLYAFLSWTVETACFALRDGRFVNRGFLNLPLNLPCGLAAAILIAALPTLEHNLFLQYLLTFIVFGTVRRFADQYVQNRRLVRVLHGVKRIQDVLRLATDALVAGIYLTAYLVVHPVIMGAMLLVPEWIIRLTVIASAVLIAMDFLCVRLALHTGGAARRQRNTQALGQRIADAVWRRLRRAYPAAQEEGGLQGRPVFAKGICKDKLFWVFLISSAIGALIEMVYCRITGGVWMNRSSVLYGAFSFVWGFGAVVLTVALQRLVDKDDRWVFLMGALIGGAYEYLCSVFTEVVFGTVFWDYSHMKGNIGGRTNIVYCIFWGILAVVWIKILYPAMERMIEKIPPMSGKGVTWTLILVMACNGLLTAGAMIRYTQRQKNAETHGVGAAFFDRRYDDTWMEARWPNMVIAEASQGEN